MCTWTSKVKVRKRMPGNGARQSRTRLCFGGSPKIRVPFVPYFGKLPFTSKVQARFRCTGAAQLRSGSSLMAPDVAGFDFLGGLGF